MHQHKFLVAFALLAGFFATGVAKADQVSDVFAPLEKELWRPIQSSVPLPQITIRFGYDYLVVSTPCVESGLSFNENNKTLTFNARNSSDGKAGESCKNPKPSLDEVSDIFSRTSTMTIINGVPTLSDDAGQPIVTLEKISPDGIEFRRLKVKAYRRAGKLQQARYPADSGEFVLLYDGWMAGSLGCGGIDGSTYTKPGPSEFKFQIISVLTGYCESALWKQEKRIMPAFKDTLKVAAQEDEFVLRDEQGREQLVLSPITEGTTP